GDSATSPGRGGCPSAATAGGTGSLLRELDRLGRAVDLEREVLDRRLAGRVVVDLGAELDAGQPHVVGEAAVLALHVVEDGLDVDLAGEVLAARAGGAAVGEVEEPPAAAPAVALVAELEVRVRDRSAGRAGPAAVAAGLTAVLPAHEGDDLGVDAGVGVGGRVLLADPELEVRVPERRVREGDVEGVDVDAGGGQAGDLDRQQLGRRERRAVAQAAGHAEGRHAEFDLGEVRVVVVRLAAVAARELPADGLVGVHEHGLHRARAIQAVGAPAVVDEAHVAEIEVGVGGAGHVARLGQRDAALIDVAGAAGRARAVGAARARAVGAARAGGVGAAAAGAVGTARAGAG